MPLTRSTQVKVEGPEYLILGFRRRKPFQLTKDLGNLGPVVLVQVFRPEAQMIIRRLNLTPHLVAYLFFGLAFLAAQVARQMVHSLLRWTARRCCKMWSARAPKSSARARPNRSLTKLNPADNPEHRSGLWAS